MTYPVAGLPPRNNFGTGFAAGAAAVAPRQLPSVPVLPANDPDPAWYPQDPLYADRNPFYVADAEGPAGRFETLDSPQLLHSADLVQFDAYIPAWEGSGYGQSPYQVDLPVGGPVNGDDEAFTNFTLQPDYWMLGQYGPATGGGTPMHETQAAYYQSIADQVERNYAASALFAVV